MGQLKPDQYAAARRMIDEEIIGAYINIKGKYSIVGMTNWLPSCRCPSQKAQLLL